MYRLEQIDEKTLPETIVKPLQRETTMIYKSNFIYYALFDDESKNILVIIAIQNRNNKNIRIEAIWTIPEYRGYGFGTIALKQVCDLYIKDYDIYADCLESSKSIFLKNGFELIKTLKLSKFDLHKCIYRKEKHQCQDQKVQKTEL